MTRHNVKDNSVTRKPEPAECAYCALNHTTAQHDAEDIRSAEEQWQAFLDEGSEAANDVVDEEAHERLLEAQIDALEAENDDNGRRAFAQRRGDPAASEQLERGDFGLPRVVQGTDVHRVMDELEAALCDPRTGDPRLFRRGGELVITRGITADDAKRLRIKVAPEAMIVARLSNSSLLPRITEHVDYGHWERDEHGAWEWKPGYPSPEIRAAFLTKADSWPLARIIHPANVTARDRGGEATTDDHEAMSAEA